MKKIKFFVNVEVVSGLHIGAGNDSVEIGGIDNPVIKDVITGRPYIPGSSIKGKIRHLLTEMHGDNKNLDIVFGVGAKDRDSRSLRATRVQFVDLHLSDASAAMLEDKLGVYTFTEIKYENQITRSGIATNPRPLERVPRGAIFEGDVILTLFEDDLSNEQEYVELLKEGFKLLNNSYLGGSGSRGSGRVEVMVKEVDYV